MESGRSETRGLGTADKRESKTEHVRVIVLLTNVVQIPMTQGRNSFHSACWEITSHTAGNHSTMRLECVYDDLSFRVPWNTKESDHKIYATRF